MKETAPLVQKYAFLDRMNNHAFMARFSMLDQEHEFLAADYYLVYDRGIAAQQIVSSIAMFAAAVSGAISDCDQDGLVEK